MDPFQGYKNALKDRLGDAVAVVDAFHVVKLVAAYLNDVAAAFSTAPWPTVVAKATPYTGSVRACAPGVRTSLTGKTRAWQRRATPASSIS
nr:transposase [Dermacoccus nishinomiyaensis]